MNKPAALQRFKTVFNELNTRELHRLEEIYTPDVRFIDPVHELNGLDAVRGYYRNLYEGVLSCRFDYDDEIVQNDRAAIVWTMHFEHQRFRKQGAMQLTGVSHLRFGDHVYYHHDYFDMGAFIYERIPVLSTMIRAIKRRF